MHETRNLAVTKGKEKPMKDLLGLNGDIERGQRDQESGDSEKQIRTSGGPQVRTSIAGQVWLFWPTECDDTNECIYFARSTWDVCKYPTPAKPKFIVSGGDE